MLDFSGWKDWTAADRPYVPRYPHLRQEAANPTPPKAQTKAAPRETFPFDVTQVIRETLAVRFPDAFEALLQAFRHWEELATPLRL